MATVSKTFSLKAELYNAAIERMEKLARYNDFSQYIQELIRADLAGRIPHNEHSLPNVTVEESPRQAEHVAPDDIYTGRVSSKPISRMAAASRSKASVVTLNERARSSTSPPIAEPIAGKPAPVTYNPPRKARPQTPPKQAPNAPTSSSS